VVPPVVAESSTESSAWSRFQEARAAVGSASETAVRGPGCSIEPAGVGSFRPNQGRLERAGRLIDDFDIAVAAIALAHDAQVITANLPTSPAWRGCAAVTGAERPAARRARGKG